MRRDHKTERDKKLIAMLRRYNDLSFARRQSGTWQDVEPYQRGWMRYFVLRDDANNRNDAHELRQVLDRINVVKYCNREDFLVKNWKTNQFEPMPHKLKSLMKFEYDALSEKQQSYFTLQTWVDVTRHRKFLEKTVVSGYVFRYQHLVQFRVAPNIITQHWIPDGEVESQYGELRRTIEAQHLWPKMYKAIGEGTGWRDWRDGDKAKYRNLDGMEFFDTE